MNPRNFFDELKRRNVYKVAIAYAVVGWLLVQVATQVFPFFEIPNWVVRLVVLLILLGLPIALVIAWAFELTPQGLKRTETADAEPQAGRRRKGAWIYVVLLAGAASIGLFFAGRFTAPKTESGTTSGSAKSIAVLPFENLSADKENAYFASGMQDMVLTKLADIGDLKVVSRTSTEKYKSHPEDLKTIARELGVAHILEGSVQKAGNQVLINVQLIDVATDEHLWAQAYTRTLDNIFGVEGEVAEKVAKALKAKLSPAEAAAVAKVPTHNKQAYDAVLKAYYYLNQSNRTGDQEDLERSVSLFQQAVSLDPDYADAYAGLAFAYSKLGGHSPEQAAAARRAIELNPDSAGAHKQMAFVFSDEGKSKEAVAEAERAAELQPRNVGIQSGLGFTYFLAGRFDDAIATFRRAVELEPNSSTGHRFLSLTLAAQRRYAEARDALQAGLARDPGDMSSVQNLAEIYILGWGDLDSARKVLQAAAQGPDQSIPLAQAWYEVDLYARDYAAALAVIEKAPTRLFVQSGAPKELYLARGYQAQGDAVRAKAAFSDARQQLEAWIKVRPDARNLHANLALTLAGLGEFTQARAEAEEGLKMNPVGKAVITKAPLLAAKAEVEARSGDTEGALQTLQELLQTSAGNEISVAKLKLDPAWDPIRKDPRFQKLIANGEEAVKPVASP